MGFVTSLSVILPLLQAVAAGGPGGTMQAGGRYAGSNACKDCHAEASAQFAATAMGRAMLEHPKSDKEKLGCEGCHGPGADHVASGGENKVGMVNYGRKAASSIAEQNASCLQCHEGAARTMWDGSAHEARDVACTDCHTVMKDVSERNSLRAASTLATCGSCHLQRRSQQLRFSHMPQAEGKLECSSCHNPHGSPNDKLLTAASTNDLCYQCHTEKRGPFTWEHPPVLENCSNCHDAHGSNHEKMLVISKARLCQQCHVDSRHPSRPYTTNDLKQWGSRQCANCHTTIHGSNHPSGFAFTR